MPKKTVTLKNRSTTPPQGGVQLTFTLDEIDRLNDLIQRFRTTSLIAAWALSSNDLDTPLFSEEDKSNIEIGLSENLRDAIDQLDAAKNMHAAQGGAR